MAAMVTSVTAVLDLMNYQTILTILRKPVQTSATYSGTFSKYRFWMPGVLHSLASTNILTVMSFILEQELRICPSARFTMSFHKLLLLQCRLFSTTSTSSPSSSFRSLWLHVQDYGGSLAYSSIFFSFLRLVRHTLLPAEGQGLVLTISGGMPGDHGPSCLWETSGHETCCASRDLLLQAIFSFVIQFLLVFVFLGSTFPISSGPML